MCIMYYIRLYIAVENPNSTYPVACDMSADSVDSRYGVLVGFSLKVTQVVTLDYLVRIPTLRVRSLLGFNILKSRHPFPQRHVYDRMGAHKIMGGVGTNTHSRVSRQRYREICPMGQASWY